MAQLQASGNLIAFPRADLRNLLGETMKRHRLPESLAQALVRETAKFPEISLDTALTFALLGGPATWSLRGGSLGLMPGLGALLLGPLLKNRLEADVPSVKQLVLRRALRRPASPVAMRPDALRLLRISLGAAFAIALILNNVLRHSATAAVRLLMAVALIAIALFWALRSGLLVLPFLRRLYGMGRVRAVVVADGPLPPDLHSFWSGLGVTLTPTEEHRDA